MGIYVCKHLYIYTYSPKHDLIVLNRCAQHHQLRMNYNLTGFIAFKVCADNLKYGNYVYK